jgi:histidine ammonia-lyase/phenylalanine ammonia-lyase
VVEIVERVAAIHLLALCQAADLRGAHKLGRTATVYHRIRRTVPFVGQDRAMDEDIMTVVDLIRTNALVGADTFA